MAFDLNLRRCKREMTIANSVVAKIGKNLENPLIGAPEFLLSILKGACDRSGFALDEDGARRVFGYVQKEIARRQQKAAEVSEAFRRHGREASA